MLCGRAERIVYKNRARRTLASDQAEASSDSKINIGTTNGRKGMDKKVSPVSRRAQL